MTQVIDGKAVSSKLLEALKHDIATLKSAPGLAVILVGDNPASKSYIGMKKKACANLGVQSFEFLLPEASTESELIDVIDTLNARKEVHGILLQMPLPKHFDEQAMLHRIAPEKDVDGFHPVNVGNLLIGRDTFKSCTPFGVMALLQHYNIQTEGKHVVIVGRSNIVGKPMAMLLINRDSTRGPQAANATVTICHSRTTNLAAITRTADVLIAAIGKANFITADMVQPGAVVVDVGINRTAEGLVGDVNFDDVSTVAQHITPVPGGVGPLTVTMLMHNTLTAARIQTSNAAVE